MKIVAITDASGAVIAPEMLVAAESVHRQLRPQIPPQYVDRMKEIFAGGAEMAVVVVDGKVAGITVFRVIEKTFTGRELYCDDLITDETQRSTGVGRAMMEYMEKLARERKCDHLALDSGCQRQQAHKFYFREKLTITSFHFSRRFEPPVSSDGGTKG